MDTRITGGFPNKGAAIIERKRRIAMKGIVSFDMDMTLLNHADYKIPDSAIEAIEALRKNHFIVKKDWIMDKKMLK